MPLIMVFAYKLLMIGGAGKASMMRGGWTPGGRWGNKPKQSRDGVLDCLHKQCNPKTGFTTKHDVRTVGVDRVIQ